MICLKVGSDPKQDQIIRQILGGENASIIVVEDNIVTFGYIQEDWTYERDSSLLNQVVVPKIISSLNYNMKLRAVADAKQKLSNECPKFEDFKGFFRSKQKQQALFDEAKEAWENKVADYVRNNPPEIDSKLAFSVAEQVMWNCRHESGRTKHDVDHAVSGRNWVYDYVKNEIILQRIPSHFVTKFQYAWKGVMNVTNTSLGSKIESVTDVHLSQLIFLHSLFTFSENTKEMKERIKNIENGFHNLGVDLATIKVSWNDAVARPFIHVAGQPTEEVSLEQALKVVK